MNYRQLEIRLQTQSALVTLDGFRVPPGPLIDQTERIVHVWLFRVQLHRAARAGYSLLALSQLEVDAGESVVRVGVIRIERQAKPEHIQRFLVTALAP